MIDENTAQTTNIPIPMFKSNLIVTKAIASIPPIKLKTGNKTDIAFISFSFQSIRIALPTQNNTDTAEYNVRSSVPLKTV